MNVIVTNARVVTMNSGRPTADAQAVQSGRIVVVGSTDEIMTHRQSDTTMIDAEGKTVLPGFIEPHNQMIMFGTSLLAVDVRTLPNRTIGDIIEWMRRPGVIPDFFDNHIHFWGDRHRDRFLGPDRVMRLDPVGSAIRAGFMPTLHSDCPVTPVSPLFCIQSAVHRVTSSGEPLNVRERISVEDGITTMTRNAARAAFQENSIGTLEVGKLGDFAILEQDPFSVAPHDIGQIEVAATVVNGHLMYGESGLVVG